MFIRFTSFIISLQRGGMRTLSSEYETDQPCFKHWMSYIPFKLMKGITGNPEDFSGNT